MTRTIVIIVLLTIIGTEAGLTINKRIKIFNLNEMLQQIVGKDQSLTEAILKIESGSTSINYEELIDLCDKSVGERTKMVVELRGLYPNMENQLRDSVTEFLNNENELVRSKSRAYSRNMNLSNNFELYLGYNNDYTYNEHSYDHYKAHCRELEREMTAGASDMLVNLQNFKSNYSLLINSESNLAALMKKEGLNFIPVFDKYKQANLQYVDDNNTYANLIHDKYGKE